MLVMKFGGASVKDALSVKNVAEIIRGFKGEKILAVVSAMDKTTNQLEILAWNARDHRETETWQQLDRIRNFHLSIVNELFGDAGMQVTAQLQDWFSEIADIAKGVLLLGEFPPRTYDRIVAYGELLATSIVTHYLNHSGITAALVDSRRLIRTDASYTQANVVWSLTQENIRREVPPLLEKYAVVIAPGFIASSTDDKVTTLGREGSDYSAAIFAACLGAEKMVVWKDVPGIMSGDPRVEKSVVRLDRLSYEEAVEMTFYGATVLHPKTIKPLFGENIPLFVRSFLDKNSPGSLISSTQGEKSSPPTSRIRKRNLALLSISSRDFSFMDETLLGIVFSEVSRSGLNLSLVQTTAIHLYLVVNNSPDALRGLESRLADRFSVEVQAPMSLLTLIHFSAGDLKEAKGAVLVQQAENKLFVLKPES